VYNNHFGFSESPFNITPNARFYHRTQSCEEILKIVQHGIESRKGLIVVTGEPGTGKTLFVKFWERDLSPKVKAVIVQNPRTDFDRMLQLVLDRLDLHGVADDRTARLDQLTCHLIEQRSQGVIVCLLVDEAQDLDLGTLDELRLLANLEFEGDALLPIVLIGQPELNQKLDHPSATRIKQRIALTRSTHPLVRMEIAPYIQWRLKVAGFEQSGLFHPEAIDTIAAYSGGIPRMVNSICDNSLIRAYTENQKVISREIIDQVARDLRITAPFSLQRQFTRAKLDDTANASAPIGDGAAYAAEERLFRASEQRRILPEVQAEDIRANLDANTAPDVVASPESAAGPGESSAGLPGLNSQTGLSRDVVSVRARWYGGAAVVGLLLVLLDIMSSSRLPLIYSAAATAQKATVLDASSYSRSRGEERHNVGFIEARFATSPSTSMTATPRRIDIAASQPRQGLTGDASSAPRNASRKKTGSVKASQEQATRDGEVRRANAADSLAANGNRNEAHPKTLRVIAASLLRKQPSASAAIVSALEPGSRVMVVATSGDFYQVRSLDKNPIRGYVHREDAFFERKK
jgi:general secretion pathway protein A